MTEMAVDLVYWGRDVPIIYVISCLTLSDIKDAFLFSLLECATLPGARLTRDLRHNLRRVEHNMCVLKTSWYLEHNVYALAQP